MSLARRTLQVVAFICTLIVGTASMIVIVTQTTWFKEWLRGFIVRQSEDYVNGRLSIGRLDGNLFFGVELEDIDVTMNGKTVVGIKDAGLDYNVLTFLMGHVVRDDIRLNEPVIRVEKTAEGWNITRLIKARTPDPDEPKRRLPIEIGEIGVSNGTLFVDDQAIGTSGVDVPSRINKLDASIGVKSDEDVLEVDIGHASFRAEGPALGVNALSGVIRRTENTVTLEDIALRTEESSLSIAGTIDNIEGGSRVLNLEASSDKLAVGELAKLFPVLERYRDLQPAFEITASGPVDHLSVDVNARENIVGKIIGDVIVDAAAPRRRISGAVSMEHFNAAPLFNRPSSSAAWKTDVTGQAQIDLALPSGRRPLSGTYAIDASRAEVAGYDMRDLHAQGRIDGRTIAVNGSAAGYGGRATSTGTIRTGDIVAVDLAGRAVNVDLRNLPPALKAPSVPSDLHFEYTLSGRGRVYTADLQLDSSTLAGATIAPGTTARFTVGGGAPRYAATGTVSNLDVQAVGRGFGVRALAADRFRSRVNAAFDLTGSGGGSHPLAIDASGRITDSQLFGASVPRLDFTTAISGDDTKVRAVGQFGGLDPSVITGDRKMAGQLTGAVDVDTTIRDYARGITVDSLDASGRVNLANSTFAGLKIDTAVIDGTYANRAGHLNQVAITGPDINVQAQGPIALNETGASNVTVHAESASLERVGEIIGRPLKGAAIVDATVTGNAGELKAQGTLKGSDIGYADNEALTLASSFAVTIPDLMPADATVEAKSTATFVEIAGRNITELNAETTYSQPKLDFTATAKEGMRELTTGGSAILHPDHHEIHLQNVALQAEQIRWESEPGAEVAIQYAKDRIAVDNVRLVSGDQRIEADGVIGSASEPLRVRAENVDVAQLDQLLLGEQRLAGRLTANATVTGTTREPRVAGEFTLTQGAFRQVMFESFAGTIESARRGMNVDVRLQQSPQAWLTAKGYAPLTLFRPTPPELADVHEVAAPGEAVDLQVTSSQIDLGLVQGFTTYVTNVMGVMQANFKVTGTGHDPHLDGTIDIKGGAFAIPILGIAYTGLDTRIDLTPDALTVSEMRVVDKHNKVMTIGGTLAVHERAVGAVDIKLRSTDFEALDNQYANNLRVDTDLRLTGTMHAPRLEGFVEIDSGTIDVSRVLEEATATPYATEATVVEPQQAAAPLTADVPNVFDALDLNVGLAVPSSLVLRGQDLRPANAPIDIGDMTVTVGGAVQLRKTPGQKVRLIGEVNTVRGSYTFQGRRFDILRDGRIRFAGTEEIDPLVNLRARRVISGVETFVHVRGTLREPELTFSSNPPLEQADILSLIIFNLPVNQLAEGQQVSLAQQAGALAGAYLTSGLARSIGNALELDEFEIQALGESGATPSLTIGEQIGKRTFFRIRQGFGAEQATEFILEYQIADYLRLQGSVAETSGGTQRVTFRRIERGGIDLIFFFSY